MKYAYAPLGITIELSRDSPTFLVIENHRAKREFVENCWLQFNGKTGKGILSENEKEIPFDKFTEVIINPFAIELNSAKIRKQLLLEADEIVKEYAFQHYLEVRSGVEAFFENVLQYMPYPISSKVDISINSLMKYADINVDMEEMQLSEKIVEYIKLLQQICRTRCVIFIDIYNYLEMKDWEEIIKTAEYLDMKTLIIESKECDYSLKHRTVIIDTDLCIINHENFPDRPFI